MAGKNYSVLVGVELDTKNVQQQLDKNLKNLKIDLDTKDANKGLDNLNSSMVDTYLTFQAANEIFSTSIDIIKSMIDQVYALNSATIEFQKVSDLSGESLENYILKLSDMGETVARTGSEMLQATTEFRKNGFNDEDAAQLGQIASMYQNVSDEAISAADSASFIIAQMVAFGIEAENAEHIIDSVNEV